MVKGIGPHFAKKLVKAFGEQVFDVIEQTPERLLDLPGIGQKRQERVTGAWADQKVIREIMVFLQSHGVSTSRSVRIYKTYGEQAIEKVRENPYRLALDIQITCSEVLVYFGLTHLASLYDDNFAKGYFSLSFIFHITTFDETCLLSKTCDEL